MSKESKPEHEYQTTPVEGWWKPPRARRPHYFVGFGGFNPTMESLCEGWRVQIADAGGDLQEKLSKHEVCGVCWTWWRLRTRQYRVQPAYRNFK
jgi:hypothetical protein